MRYVMYMKGKRGRVVFEALNTRGLTPTGVVLEKNDPDLIAIVDSASCSINICDRPNSPDHKKWIKAQAPQLIVAVGYSKILPKDILDIPSLCAINCHAGLLPYYRGASPIPWQILRGETKGGAYVLKMTIGIDDGPIFASEEYEIGSEESARDIVNKVNEIFGRLIPEVVKAFSGGSEPPSKEQSSEGACTWTRRIPSDGLIEWDKLTAREVVDLVRALDDPYPGAYTFCDKNKMIIHKAIVLPEKVCGIPGRYVGKKCGLPAIIASDRAVGLVSFSVSGKKTNEIKAPYGTDMS